MLSPSFDKTTFLIIHVIFLFEFISALFQLTKMFLIVLVNDNNLATSHSFLEYLLASL